MYRSVPADPAAGMADAGRFLGQKASALELWVPNRVQF